MATELPATHTWPGGDAVGSAAEPLYWLTPEEDTGATQTFSVIAALPEGQHIAATGCYLSWGIRIVDALRAQKEV